MSERPNDCNRPPPPVNVASLMLQVARMGNPAWIESWAIGDLALLLLDASTYHHTTRIKRGSYPTHTASMGRVVGLTHQLTLQLAEKKIPRAANECLPIPLGIFLATGVWVHRLELDMPVIILNRCMHSTARIFEIRRYIGDTMHQRRPHVGLGHMPRHISCQCVCAHQR